MPTSHNASKPIIVKSKRASKAGYATVMQHCDGTTGRLISRLAVCTVRSHAAGRLAGWAVWPLLAGWLGCIAAARWLAGLYRRCSLSGWDVSPLLAGWLAVSPLLVGWLGCIAPARRPAGPASPTFVVLLSSSLGPALQPRRPATFRFRVSRRARSVFARRYRQRKPTVNYVIPASPV